MTAEQLQGRRVLVTGGSSGIGRAVATAVADAGGHVVATGRDEERLAEVAAHDRVTAVTADLTERDQVDGLVADAVAALGGLDVVVNSAGVARPSGVVDADRDDWRLQLDVNVLAVLDVTQAAMPHLLDSDHGHVVNVSSMSGRRVASWQMSVYSATKFAVHALSEGLRKEVAEHGVKVTVVSPGYVDTPIFSDVDEEYESRTEAQGLAPDDVARAIVHALAQPPEVQVHEIALTSLRQFG